MKLIFVNDSRAVDGKVFRKNLLNPGVGGIEYLTAVLAIRLAKIYQRLEILIISSNPFYFEEELPNLSIKVCENKGDLTDYWEPGDTLVLTTSFIRHLDYSFLNKAKSDIILWSHHPSDWHTLKYTNYCRALVSTGIYQYNSNYRYHNCHSLIPNLYIPLQDKKRDTPNCTEINNFMFLGALVPAKGFHLVLKQWKEIKKKYPNAHLHVIGGSDLYGLASSANTDIPCEPTYKKIILEIIEKDRLSLNDITFYGSLGEQRFQVYQYIDFAIINPSGKSESFSFNLHECLDFGLPTFASNRYGLNDVMKKFPDFALTRPKLLSKLIFKTLKQENAIAKWYHIRDETLNEILNRNEEIPKMWFDLIMNKKTVPDVTHIDKETIRAYFYSVLGRLKHTSVCLGIFKR